MQQGKQVRQGDVLLVEVSKADFLARQGRQKKKARKVARKKGHVILALGEVTGHAHVIDTPGVEMFRFENGDRMLVSESGDISLDHVNLPTETPSGDHNSIQLPAEIENDDGKHYYEVVQQREFTPTAPVYVRD